MQSLIFWPGLNKRQTFIAVRFIGWIAIGVYLFAAYLVSHAAGATPERRDAIGAAISIMALGYPLGRVVGWFLARDSDVDETGFQVVAWANLLGWLVPVVGATISTMTWRFARRSPPHDGTLRLLHRGALARLRHRSGALPVVTGARRPPHR